MSKKKTVKIEIMMNADQTKYEVYLDGNRMIDTHYEQEIIELIGRQYLSLKLA